jgi:hypothetical protein
MYSSRKCAILAILKFGLVQGFNCPHRSAKFGSGTEYDGVLCTLYSGTSYLLTYHVGTYAVVVTY